MPKIAVMPLSAKRVPIDMVQVLDEVLLNQLQTLNRYTVVSTTEINAMLGFERMRSAVGCEETVCASEIGGALGVDLLMIGSVGKLGESTYLSLQVIDIQTTSVLQRQQLQVPAKESLYPQALDELVHKVLGLPYTPPPAAAPKQVEHKTRVWPWITAALTVAAGGTALTFFLLARADRNAAEELADPRGQDAEFHAVTALEDSFERNRLIGYVATGAASVFLVTTVMVAIAGRDKPDYAIAPFVMPDGAGLVYSGSLPW